MTFDQYGHLTPYELIETDLSTFEAVFVGEFATSTTRPQIFEAYLSYLEQLKGIIGTEFYQWIDGSFVTQKHNPRDIDFVTFVDFELIKKHEIELNQLRKLRHEGVKFLDNYFVAVYAKSNTKFNVFEIDRLDWLNRFEKDTRKRMIHKKGIIQLKF